MSAMQAVRTERSASRYWVILMAAAAFALTSVANAADRAAKTVAGYRLSFDVATTGSVPEQLPGHSTSMHHEPSISEATRHIAISIADTATGERVEDADVTLYIIPRFKGKEQERDLNAMKWDEGTAYGAYIVVPKNRKYWFLVSFHRRSNPEVIEAFIDYPFPLIISSDPQQ